LTTVNYQQSYLQFINKNINFNDFYQSLKSLLDIHKRKAMRTYNFDEHTAQEIFDDVILTITEGIDNFEHWLNKALHLSRIDYDRKRVTKRKYEVVHEYISETAATVKGADVELLKKETDHRQVIDFLVRHSPSDAATTAIVEAYLFTPGSVSRKEIARTLGLHHEVVKRKLNRLSRYYDGNRFGDIYDYLAV